VNVSTWKEDRDMFDDIDTTEAGPLTGQTTQRRTVQSLVQQSRRNEHG
jgi:hypothetical protein